MCSTKLVPPRSPKYTRHSPFWRDLQSSVNEQLKAEGLPHSGGRRLLIKALVIVVWALLSYLSLVFWAETWWQAGTSLLSLALAIAAVGFNIQHDGGHRASSSGRLANYCAAMSLDAIGGSAFVWAYKHNVLHHTYPNVDGWDNDLEAGPLLRLSAGQKRRSFHRFQHIYAWVLYGALVIKWHFFDDYIDVVRGRVGEHRLRRPRGLQWLQFLGGKAFFYGWALVLPLFFHPASTVLSAYLLGAAVVGIVLATVFQLAHCVPGASVTQAPVEGEFSRGWAEHQVATTVNFAPENRVLTWLLGGLNYQLEHHLFPRISHVHYPFIAPVVRTVCTRHGLRYRSSAGLLAALGSHARHLRALGAD